MKNHKFIAVSTICYTTLVIITRAQVILKTCSRDNLLSCPKYSLCSEMTNENEAYKCVCLESFILNINWLENDNSTHYCLPSEKINTAQENKLITYMRSPARKEHLVIGILMVLMAAVLATVVLYGLKVLRPLKRTKSVYQKLRYKRRNVTPLQEMDELELNRRYEMQTL